MEDPDVAKACTQAANTVPQRKKCKMHNMYSWKSTVTKHRLQFGTVGGPGVMKWVETLKYLSNQKNTLKGENMSASETQLMANHIAFRVRKIFIGNEARWTLCKREIKVLSPFDFFFPVTTFR